MTPHVPLTSNLDVEVGVQQQVLGLEVSVDDSSPVAVRHGGNDLAELPASLFLVHAPVGQKVVCTQSGRIIHVRDLI